MAERFGDEVAPKLAELLLEVPGVKQFMDRIKAFTSIFGGGGGELWEAMVEELCDVGPGVLGRLPDGAEDVIGALCTFQAEGMDGLSDIVEAKHTASRALRTRRADRDLPRWRSRPS